MTDFPVIKSLYTDGACSGNPGPGGWAAVVYFTDGAVHELGGGDRQTTNNRMEMQAAIEALRFLKNSQQNQPISLFTDSEYVMKGITQWIHGWKKKGWKTAGGKPVVNQDLWETLDQLNSRQVSWNYVRGHAGDPGNERCDAIARAYSLNQPIHLKQVDLRQSHNLNSPDNCHENYERVSEETVQSRHSSADSASTDSMIDSSSPSTLDTLENLPREVRVAQLRNTVEALQMADEIAQRGYLITSSELADLMDVNASAVTSRGDNWVWRNWVISRVRREGNQILWQLERVD